MRPLPISAHLANPRRLLPVGAGLLLAVLWPVTAYRVSPVLLPAVLALCGLAVVVLRRPAAGVAAVLALTPLQNLTIGGVRPMNLVIPAIAAGLVGLILLRPYGAGARPRLPPEAGCACDGPRRDWPRRSWRSTLPGRSTT